MKFLGWAKGLADPGGLSRRAGRAPEAGSPPNHPPASVEEGGLRPRVGPVRAIPALARARRPTSGTAGSVVERVVARCAPNGGHRLVRQAVQLHEALGMLPLEGVAI